MSPAEPTGLVAHGWGPWAAASTAGFERPGRVVRVEYGAAVVRVERGEVTADWTAQAARAAGVDASPVVGDWVDVRKDDDEGWVVTAVADRWTALERHDPAEDLTRQVLAANVDLIGVVAAADAPLNVRRLDRMLAMAWGSGADVELLLTKNDLADDVDERAVHEVAGPAPWRSVSGTTSEGLEGLRTSLDGRTAVFVGPSGVGKSTLVNALVGTELQVTAPVRARDHKGRHTTTTRSLIPVPTGGVVIDTPGIRAVQLWDPSHGVDRHFEDLADLARRCRFGDCAHRSEPGCAVRAAVEDGSVAADRVERWAELRDEADRWAERREVRGRGGRR